MSEHVRVNLETLYAVWRHAQSGLLRLAPRQRQGAEHHSIPVARGGMLDKQVWDLLLESLESHVYTMEEGLIGGRGNRALMGALIQAACRRHRCAEAKLVAVGPIGSVGGPRHLNLMPAITLPPFLRLPELQEEDEPISLQEQLYRQGRALLDAGDYEQADLVLSAARDLRLDHAPTLACLARARFQNPARGPAERERDAATMVRMAWLLAPDDSEVVRSQELVLGSVPRFTDRRVVEI